MHAEVDRRDREVRDDNVEKARAGDRMVFTGSLIVIGKRCLL